MNNLVLSLFFYEVDMITLNLTIVEASELVNLLNSYELYNDHVRIKDNIINKIRESSTQKEDYCIHKLYEHFVNRQGLDE